MPTKQEVIEYLRRVKEKAIQDGDRQTWDYVKWDCYQQADLIETAIRIVRDYDPHEQGS
jgi:uncharacterized Zn finger protein